MPSTTQTPDETLDALVAGLEGTYGHRRAHQGRLDQIRSAVTGLKSHIAQLPEEEAREAEFEGRLLGEYDANPMGWQKDKYGHDAHERLRDALERRNGNGA